MSAPVANASKVENLTKKKNSKKNNKRNKKKSDAPRKPNAGRPRPTKSVRSFQDTPKLVSSWKLTSAEYKKASEWLLNMLDPKKPFKMPRPITALSSAELETGEIVFDTTEQFVEVFIKPDPFAFIRIYKREGNDTVSFTSDNVWNQDFGQLSQNGNSESLINGVYHNFAFSNPMPLQSGKFLPPQIIHTGNAVDNCFRGGDLVQGSLMGFEGLAFPTSLSSVLTNNSLNAVEYYLDWKVYTTAGVLVYQTPGTTVTVVNARSSSAPQANPLTPVGAPVGVGQLGVISIRLKNNGTTPIALDQIQWRLNTFADTVTAPVSQEVYTIGEAEFGKGDPTAQILDDIFQDSLLWAPCACAMRFNVDQQLNTAGGRFQTSYLGSNINTKLPIGDFESTWTFVSSKAKSYPVAETDFVVGSQGSWVGMRIQDYEFRKPFAQEQWLLLQDQSLPEIHFIAKKNAQTASVTTRLNFAFAYEIQTLHPAYTMTPGSFSPDFLGYISAICSSHEYLVGENPSHVQRLVKMAKQVLSNPMVQKSFKELIAAGLLAL